mmetsp:Transcript_19461/g.58809  ORF Transcript_19461/g.58809 Transcript_19461/m.58809 type:complete len:90 (-) Transcript_19461:522-791(-)
MRARTASCSSRRLLWHCPKLRIAAPDALMRPYSSVVIASPRALVASSMITSAGDLNRTLAMAKRCTSPTDSWPVQFLCASQSPSTRCSR